MKYCKVTLNQMPRPIFAHTYESENYEYNLPKIDNILELVYIEQGCVNIYHNGKFVRSCPEKSLQVIYNKEDLVFKSDAPLHRHITVGLFLDFMMLPIPEEKINEYCQEKERGECFAILPLDEGIELPTSSKIPEIIREIIGSYSNNSTGNKLLLVSAITRLLSEITQECVRRSFVARQISPIAILYTEKAMQYIAEHIQEKIGSEEIAKEIGISSRYLRGIFKMITGRTLTEHINITKLQLAKELVLSQKMSFTQAGEYVGIPDSSYLSRLFRKHLGMTIRELKSNRYIIPE